jgi:virginiamycin B lyase
VTLRAHAALLAVAFALGTGGASSRGVSPHVTEFGGTFGSDLGGIALGRDGTVWVNEHDRVAHIGHDGRVHEYRLPIDVYQGRPRAAGTIGLGPGGDMWFDAACCAGRIAPDGRIRLYDVPPRPSWRYVSAFTVSPNGVWFTYGTQLPGIFHIDARGVRSTSDADLDRISGLAVAPDGALWIAAITSPTIVSIYRRARGAERRSITDLTTRMGSVLGVTPSGSLLTARFEWEPRSAHIERIDPNGHVTTLTEFEPSGYSAQIGAAAVGRDGTIWLTEPSRNRLARIAPDGSLHDVRRGLPDIASPSGIAADAGGAWFTDVANGIIGVATADGIAGLIGHGPIPESTPALPAVASDGAVWFRESFDWRRRLARLAPNGTLREFPDAGSGPLVARGRDVLVSMPQGIVAFAPDGAQRPVAPRVAPQAAPPGYSAPGFATAAATAPDGAAWFAVDGALARIDRNGAVRTIPMHELRPDSIAFDAAGTLWFTETNRSLIGSVAHDGRVRTHTHGLTRWHSGPQWIARGPDGAMWFTEVRDRIGRIDAGGRITEFAHGIPYRSSPGGIAAGPDGALWFTLWHGNVLGRMTTDGRVTLHRGLVTPSRGNEHDPDAVLVPDGHGGFWFNESQGGRIAHLTFN